MPIVVDCSRCGKEYEVEDAHAGRKFRCRKCDAVVRVPERGRSRATSRDDWDDDEDLPEPGRRRSSGGERRPSRGRSGGVPIAVVVAVVCESLLLLLLLGGFVTGLVRQDWFLVVHGSSRAAIAGLTIAGFLLGQNGVRWITVFLDGAMALLTPIATCVGLAFFGGVAVLRQESLSGATIPVAVVVLIVVMTIYVTEIVTLLVPSSREYFERGR